MTEEIEVVDTRPDRSNPKEYEDGKCVLDRVLVRRIVQDTVGGLEVPDKFRQHSNWGTIVEIGQCVVLSGAKFPITDFVEVGDLVKYGEYTAENFDLNDPDLFIIRVQDIRFHRRLKRG